MRIKLCNFLLMFIGVLWSCGLVMADTSPNMVNYQGRLTDLNSAPVVDGTHLLVINLYTTEDATSAVWTNNYSATTKNGYFNVVLSGGIPEFSTLDFSRRYWLGIRVDTDSEMLPRQSLNSVPYAMSSPLQFNGYRIFTSGSGTYTPTAGTRAILVEVQGGGGGGGGVTGVTGSCAAASGGGSGGYVKSYITSLASSYSYTVGQSVAGGAAGGNNPGIVGNSSTFSGGTVSITAGGGGRGAGSASYSAPQTSSAPAVGGTASGGDVNIPGQRSAIGLVLGNTTFGACPSLGANSKFGAGGNAVNWGTGADGEDGAGYGSGGGGGCSNSATGHTGGKGAAGVIIISEFR